MKILITGGYGFLAFHLADSLKHLDCEIVLADIIPEKDFDNDFMVLLKNKNISYSRIDLTIKENLTNLGKGFTHVLHLAALLGVENVINNPHKVLFTNILMLENIITFAINLKTKPTFIFTSTSEVYAGTLFEGKLNFPTKEESLLILPNLKSKRTSYMLSKIYGEAICFASELKTIILRPHNLFGPRMGMKHVIPQLIKKIHKEPLNGEIGVYSPTHTRTFCFIKDAVRQILKIINKNIQEKDIVFNLGTQQPEIKMEILAKILLNISNRNDLKIKFLENTLGSPERRCPCTAKLDSFIDEYYRTEITKGIEETYNWYINNKDNYLA